MNKWKEIGFKLLYPNIFIFILFFVVGFGSVISVFILNLSTHWIAYISYVLSAYALTITIARSINLIEWINEKLHNNKYTNRLLTDRELKNNIKLFSGTFLNNVYGIFKVITGVIYRSVWFGATGVYYLVLGMMKLSLIKHIISKSDEKKQLTQYRNTGILMFLLNSAMVGMIILMIRDGESAVYPGFVIYAQAGYTFYILTVAIIDIIKYRKDHTPLIAASKSISLVSAIMSMFILQVAMINQFGIDSDAHFKSIINVITGSATSFLTIGIAIFMLINSKQRSK